MATPKSQRIGIWIIAIVMLVGTLGAYAAIIFANDNQGSADQQNQQLQKQYEEYMKQQQQAALDNAKSSKPLDGYEPVAFDAASITALQQEDLVVGEGGEVASGAKVKVSYFGWTPDGTIFDSTNKNGTNTPAEFELKDGTLINGWLQGVPGMKVGGVRKLTIPAKDAYGEAGSPPVIQPNTPLAFIIRVEELPQ